jgi:hypothetical protein
MSDWWSVSDAENTAERRRFAASIRALIGLTTQWDCDSITKILCEIPIQEVSTKTL